MGTRQSIIKPNNLEVIVESSKEKKDPQISISETSSSSSSRSRSPASLQVEDTKKNLDLEAAGLHPALSESELKSGSQSFKNSDWTRHCD